MLFVCVYHNSIELIKNKMNKIIIALLVLCTIYQYSNAQVQDNKKVSDLMHHFEKLLNNKPKKQVVNMLCYLENEKKAIVFSEGFGYIDNTRQEPISKNQPFKIASISKMFTSVVVLQMYEEGLINLDEYAYKYLNEIDYLNFENLHVNYGVSYGKKITIRQLLNHTSGLADIFIDTEEQFNEHVLDNRQKQWSPGLLFQKYYEFKVNEMAKFKPGTSYAYSDVGYFLLGLCIEQISNTSLAEQYRKRILNPLKLNNTYLEYYEDKTSDLEIAHAYIKDLEATKELNTSYDWSGGGLISNTADLKKFIQNLFKNKLFKNEETLKMMIDDDMYGFGISVFKFDDKIYYGHLGFWGSGIFYDPKNEITICLSINQTNPSFDAFKLIKRVRKFIE